MAGQSKARLIVSNNYSGFLLRRHFLLESIHQPGMDLCGDRLGIHTLVNFDGALCGIENYPAVGAFIDVLFQSRAQLLVD
jgi:hypothetical protein